MRYRATALALMLALAAIGPAHSSDIYKWVDAEGSVHYGDRPSGDASEERLSITSRPTNPAQIQQQVQARLDQQASAAEAVSNEPKGPSAEELATEAAERKQKCDMYTDRLQQFIEKRHLYRELEDGERYYLTEEEMQAARDDVRGRIAEYCTS